MARVTAEGLIYLTTILQFVTVSRSVSFPNNLGVAGCADKSREAFTSHPRLAACEGSWQGHIRNSSNLCSEGWHVCSWQDVDLLRTIAWSQALSIDGCYAYNAVHDRGLCQECADNTNQDDLGGVGRDCPHKNAGQNSCLASGRIDASCCIDSTLKRACTYIPGVMSGVLCCKPQEKAPHIIVSTQGRVQAKQGSLMMLECRATGKPKPEIRWYRNGEPLSNNSSNVRITAELGMLEVLDVGESDAGVYKCMAVNVAGNESQTIDVTVLYPEIKFLEKGCHDNTVEGLHHLPNVMACAGSWYGHVRNGKILCATGWHVCSVQDTDTLKEITWKDATSIDGCFAYNVANALGQCTRCTGRNGWSMAGIGKDCQRKHKKQSSCLAEGKIDAVLGQKKSTKYNCKHQPGITSGVLCCKTFPAKRKKNKPKCRSECQNGGVCGEDNRCHCPAGFKGVSCQNAICKPKCGPHGTCTKPGTCQCNPGFVGSFCDVKVKCLCFNGGVCTSGKCICPAPFKGKHCQHTHRNKKVLPWKLNETHRQRDTDLNR